VLHRVDELEDLPERSHARLLGFAREFEAIVNNNRFPCVFSGRPFTTRELYFGLVPGPDAVEDGTVALLKQLCLIIREVPDAIGVIFVDGVEDGTITDDFAVAGRIVHAVMRANAEARPGAVLPRPDDPEWMLWLEDTGLFLNFSSPRHHARRSRNVGSAFTVIAQARDSFDRLGRSSPKVRDDIRRRVSDYDDVAPHPCLGNYGDPDSREALQFFLGDGVEPLDPTGALRHGRQ
jgi:FPC/CPF motif-containing protein YcgG